MRISILNLFIFSLIVPICAGQNAAVSETIHQIEYEFVNGNVYEAEILALKALHSDVSYSPSELFEIHKYLAFCYVAYGQRDKAVKEFLEVLTINPEYRFDKQIYSPKIIEVFENAVQEYNLQKSLEPQVKNLSSYEIQIRAGKKSLIYPGLGQLYKGEINKGYFLAGAETVSLCALTFSQWQLKSSHDEYLNAVNPDDIEKKYDRYDIFYKARNISAAAVAVIYVYGFFDSVYHPVDEENISKLSMYFTPQTIGFIVKF